MLLTPSEFRHQAHLFLEYELGSMVGFDFETTGLDPYKGAKAFLMGFTNSSGDRFSVRLSPELIEDLDVFFSNPQVKYCSHNSKFEMRFLKQQFGIEVKGVVWDSEVMERIVKNNHLGYSLQKCAERIGLTKYQPMAEWLSKRGNKNQYHKAPEEIIVPYVEQDAWLSWELCRRQIERFRYWDKATHIPISPVVGLELNVLPHLFNMEDFGLMIDVNYCRRALDHEEKKIKQAADEFENETSVQFVDSRKTFVPIFKRYGIECDKTDLGNESFTEESLSRQGSLGFVRSIIAHRNATKRASTYWKNFLELENNGIIHPNINQNRAKTGRMSISDPSCQNWPTDDDDSEEFPIRRAFVARPGCKILSMDYSAMEIRLMADEANETKMIEDIKKGHDFHQETADMAGVPRSLAKNGRFAKLYGAGIRRVAQTLGVDMETSEKICRAIDQSSPNITTYTRRLIKFAEQNGYGYNFLGRRFFFDDGFFYVYPNYRIQSAGAEIIKRAICSIGSYIKREKLHPDTKLMLVIHDELLFNLHPSDMDHIPKFKEMMIASYKPQNGLPMDVGMYIGDNFYDLEEVKL